MKYIIGNWKANKNLFEVEEWFKIFAELYIRDKSENLSNLEIVVCPPFIYLEKAATLRKSHNLPIKLGAQDVSPFPNGPYTGEISASYLTQFVQYVIVGHSERRTNLGENNKILVKKVMQVKEVHLEPIFCVQDEKTFIPDGVSLVAYEPVWAIGSGKADTPENAALVAANIKNKNKIETVVYGGSVTPDNITSFLQMPTIDGVLPGGASLDAARFWQMIVNAASI